jgi:hypothetical protein
VFKGVHAWSFIDCTSGLSAQGSRKELGSNIDGTLELLQGHVQPHLRIKSKFTFYLSHAPNTTGVGRPYSETLTYKPLTNNAVKKIPPKKEEIKVTNN